MWYALVMFGRAGWLGRAPSAYAISRVNRLLAWQCDVQAWQDHYAKVSTPMKANSKTILYVKHKDGTKLVSAPHSIWADENKCRPYAVAVMTAYKAGDVETLRKLNMVMLINEDNTLKPGLIFARVTVPYEPELPVIDDDPFADPSSATS